MCVQINELKYLKLTILRFLPRPPLTYTTLIAVKTFFIVKTFIIHEFTWIYFNSHNFYIYILKCIFWGSNYFRVCGCWLVWLLLYVFIVADWLVWLLIYLTVLFYQELKKKKNFFIKVITTSKTFCNIGMYRYKFKMYKRLCITANQTNRWDEPGLCFEDQYEALQTSRKNCQLPGRPW